MKFNERLFRVQVGRDVDVPIESNSTLWLLWIKGTEWDADTVSNWKDYISNIEKADMIFCIWHGNYRTNMFLMRNKELINRLKALGKKKRDEYGDRTRTFPKV